MTDYTLPQPSDAIDAIGPAPLQTNGLMHENAPPDKVTANEITQELSNCPSNEDGKHIEPSRRLTHFPYISCLVVGYTVLAVFAWAIICTLVYRPITTRHYGLWLKEGDVEGIFYPNPSAYTQNERWFQAARVLQTIVAVVTIPLTSAVCSNAAVVFMQRKSKGAHLSLRQTIALADKGWARFDVYTQLLRGRWKQYGSTLLYIALALNLLGGVIAPLQSVFTTTTTIRTPNHVGKVQRLTDILDRFVDLAGGGTGSNLDASSLRYTLTSTSSADPQSRLWSATGALNCTNSTYGNSAACAFGQPSLGNMALLEDPFIAELPAGYNTGLVRQFLPRINSSATRVKITEAEFPSNCNESNSFYVNLSSAVNSRSYNGQPLTLAWSLIACMPGDQTVSPWANTRNRQDFTENLYLNLSTQNPDNPNYTGYIRLSGYYKITMNTTAGFFELPNHMNDNKPGPLLSDGPTKYCGRDCILQGHPFTITPIYDHNNFDGVFERRQVAAQNGSSTSITDAYAALEMVTNKGPLLSIAMAIFGPGSFVADRVANPDAYIDHTLRFNSLSCTERAPFVGLMSKISTNDFDPLASPTDEDVLLGCVSGKSYAYDELQEQILDYVNLFIDIPDIDYNKRIQNAFEGAAFLVNQLWLTSPVQATLTVSYDPGAGTQAPSISEAGIILVSLLLGLYLACLLVMALYSNWDPHWTGQLDAFAMMRLGAAIPERLPLNVAFISDRIEILDETPGWIGDATGGEGGVGQLALGAPTPLSRKRRYRCYEQESEPVKEKRAK